MGAMALPMPHHLTTARLTLAAVSNDDTADMMALYGDAETTRFLGGPFDASETFRLMALLCGHWRLLGHGIYAVRTHDGAFLGGVGLLCPDEWPEIELSYTLHAAARGKGYASEAGAAIGAAAVRAGVRTLESYIDPHNAPSKAVARRLGAQHATSIILRGEPCCVFRYDLSAFAPNELAA